MGKENKEVLYCYVKPQNKKFIEKMSLDTQNPASVCVDAILDAFRLKRDIKLAPKVTRYMEKVIKAKQTKERKIKALEEKYKRPNLG